MRILLFSVIFLFWVEPKASAQQKQISDIAVITDSQQIEAKLAATDPLGNVYVVTTTNQIYKYSDKFKQLATLNYVYTGNVTSIDVSNPLEIFVFYRELNTILFLDNNLAYRGKILLNNAGVMQAAAIARTYANGIWAFDLADLQLKKISREGTLTQTSGNVLQFVNSNIYPLQIVDDGSTVLVLDSSVGILQFDVFANFKKVTPMNHVKVFCNTALSYVVLANNELLFYRKTPFKLMDKAVVSDALGIALAKENLYLVQPNCIKKYKLNFNYPADE